MLSAALVAIPLREPLFRGARSLRIALTGAPGGGKRTLFEAVQAASVRSAVPLGSHDSYEECAVRVGLEQVLLNRWPDAKSLLAGAPAPFGPPDLILQVVDATALERHLELTLELQSLRRPLVVALNKMDEARARGMYVSSQALARRLGVPVIPTSAARGYGLAALFRAALDAARRPAPPPRAETEAERRRSAAGIARAARRPDRAGESRDLRYWLDEMFLSPRWSLAGSALVFAAALFVVLVLSGWLDSVSAARLADWASAWTPESTAGVIGRAVADGLIGLVGIVVPYMIPLMLLLVGLERSGIMARIAFAVDRAFHRVGLHGAVALPFLMGLGCNVPAISSIARVTRGRERLAASLLVTFVPCSARSALVLALAGKYLGTLGVLAIFAAAMVVIALLGKLLRSRARESEPGLIPEIPPYSVPEAGAVLRDTWQRTQDIVTIVLPLLVAGSVVLALLSHFGADALINAALRPMTELWLGLPVALGVPILFGVLRKELSLLMLYQALGSFEVDRLLDPIQLVTLLMFLMFYVPCISTFAVMLKAVGRRTALASVLLSVVVALAVSGALRYALLGVRWAFA